MKICKSDYFFLKKKSCNEQTLNFLFFFWKVFDINFYSTKQEIMHTQQTISTCKHVTTVKKHAILKINIRKLIETFQQTPCIQNSILYQNNNSIHYQQKQQLKHHHNNFSIKKMHFPNNKLIIEHELNEHENHKTKERVCELPSYRWRCVLWRRW